MIILITGNSTASSEYLVDKNLKNTTEIRVSDKYYLCYSTVEYIQKIKLVYAV